jgi:CRISPR-associated endonuclease/helicase Cas3
VRNQQKQIDHDPTVKICLKAWSGSLSAHTTPNSLRLPGLEGDNPLAFLASIGLLRILDQVEADAPPQIRWVDGATTWLPEVYWCVFQGDSDRDSRLLFDTLMANLWRDYRKHPCSIWETFLAHNTPPGTHFFQKVSCNATEGDREQVDWLAAIGLDIRLNVDSGDLDTQLRTTRRDYHPKNLRSIIEITDRSHLERSLMYQWDYGDGMANQSLHLDPSEDRRHAYQWAEPTGDPARKWRGAMLGANRLALEGIPAMPTLPCDGRLRTVGFRGHRANMTRWSWPIWTQKATFHVVRSLLTNSEIQADSPSSKKLRPLGVSQVFRSYRVLVGQTPNFTPARAVMT